MIRQVVSKEKLMFINVIYIMNDPFIVKGVVYWCDKSHKKLIMYITNIVNDFDSIK